MDYPIREPSYAPYSTRKLECDDGAQSLRSQQIKEWFAILFTTRQARRIDHDQIKWPPASSDCRSSGVGALSTSRTAGIDWAPVPRPVASRMACDQVRRGPDPRSKI